VRAQKLAKLRQTVAEVYPAHFHRTMTNDQELAEKYADIEPDTMTGDIITVAGRVYSSRNSGMFMDIHDASGKVQIFSHKDTTPEAARDLLPLIDLGDIIGVTGEVRRTKRGELTVNAHEITMLTKSLLPMPEKWHGLSDIELRYRKRHLDILTNEDSKLRFQQRSKIVSGIRRFMEDEGFMEIETPMLHSVYGGATAEPFKTHHNTLKLDMYLRIAPELYLKRALVSGLTDKVFEVNRNFRNEGVSTRHNPEFTMLECYWAYADYEDIMGSGRTAVREAGAGGPRHHRDRLWRAAAFLQGPLQAGGDARCGQGRDRHRFPRDRNRRGGTRRLEGRGLRDRGRLDLGRMPGLHFRGKGRGFTDSADSCDRFPQGHFALRQGGARRATPGRTLRDLLQRLGTGQRLLRAQRSGRAAQAHGRAA
jgi:hypothetical protein